MPDLDVNDLLADTDIAGEEIIITRAHRTVVNGRTEDSLYTVVTYGSVQPASGQQLHQLPEEQRTMATISVIVPIMLIPLSRSNAPDLVQYDGQNYRVVTANNYGHFGNGFWQGTCQLVDTVLVETA